MARVSIIIPIYNAEKYLHETLDCVIGQSCQDWTCILGEDVGYDLSWYKKNGMDVDRRFARTFELEEMFPNIRLKSFGKFKTWFYRMFLTYTSPEQRPPKVDKGKISLIPIFLKATKTAFVRQCVML